MKRLTAALIIVLGISIYSTNTESKQYRVIRAVYVYDVGNAVEVAANELEKRGDEVFQIANSGYYPTGERRVAIWVKSYSLPAPVLEYIPSIPVEDTIYGTSCPGYPNAPFPGAKCYKDGGWKN